MKKFIFGAFVFWGGFIFLAFSVMYAIKNPATYNDIGGVRGALLGNDLFGIFVISLVITMIGIGICGYEAYGKEKIQGSINKRINQMNEMNTVIKDKLYK